MCTGIEPALLSALAGGVLSGAGTMISQNQAEQQAQAQADARNKVLQATLTKNDALSEKSRALFDERAEKVQPEKVQQQQQEATEERTGVIEGNLDASPAEIPLSGSAPAVVKAEAAKGLSDTLAASRERAQALGKLGGFGDLFFRQGLDNLDASRGINLNNNFASGNLAVLPHLQDFAEARATKPISPIGGILTGLGNSLGSAGGSGYF